jgi:alpha-methylacyl-CoA racemase
VTSTTDPSLPLAGITVIDVSRMLPGAVLVRSLVDLGARVIKIEDPRSGDLMRLAPPLVGGIGVGFCVYFRGTESVGLDLRDADGAAALRLLARKADVLIESFRPGTMDRYGLATASLRADNPGRPCARTTRGWPCARCRASSATRRSATTSTSPR